MATSGSRRITGARLVAFAGSAVAHWLNRSPSVLIVPGLGDSGPEHWQTLWQARLPGAARVAQRDWDRPDRELWLQGLRAAIEAAGGPVVLVAHSLGCALVAHAVRRWPALVMYAGCPAPVPKVTPSPPAAVNSATWLKM